MNSGMMVHMDTDGGFYEDDEPVDDVIAAFHAGAKGVTGPWNGQTMTLTLSDALLATPVATPARNRPMGEPIHH